MISQRCRATLQKRTIDDDLLDFHVEFFLLSLLFFFRVSAAFFTILDRWKVVPLFEVSAVKDVDQDLAHVPCWLLRTDACFFDSLLRIPPILNVQTSFV